MRCVYAAVPTRKMDELAPALGRQLKEPAVFPALPVYAVFGCGVPLVEPTVA